MHYITDRKRAVGLGSAKSGTAHHWYMVVSSLGLAVLIPLFVLIFGSTLGSSYEEVIATFARPFPAVVTLLTFWVGMTHFRRGCQVLIEDYTDGITRKATIAAMVCASYAIMAAALYAVVRIAI
jgi:succinate dehydrogenase / fumarate reductase membrane anchor subunit